MTDVLMYHTAGGGNLYAHEGEIVLTDGLEVAAYLSLFGGNEDDDGSRDSRRQWWGNQGEPVERQYRSETQYTVRSLPQTVQSLRRVTSAAERDLADMPVDSVDVAASYPGLNLLKLDISLIIGGTESRIIFVESWRPDSEIDYGTDTGNLPPGTYLVTPDGSAYLINATSGAFLTPP